MQQASKKVKRKKTEMEAKTGDAGGDMEEDDWEWDAIAETAWRHGVRRGGPLSTGGKGKAGFLALFSRNSKEGTEL